jgi:hypothetical protein
MGNYHHHQNPSSFNLDLNVVSTVCNLYAADGLYMIDSTKHSPLIGFAYDGFPIYGAYAYKNIDGTGGIVRMKSSYSLRSITSRTTYANGNSVTAGPAVSTTYPLGYFREDYQYTAPTASDYLDEHNGRFCITPEYPNGIYCYFATVDENWNSAYPYAVGPTFYGVKNATKVTSITESVSTYTPAPLGIAANAISNLQINIFPNPASDLLAIQIGKAMQNNINIALYDITGKLIKKDIIYQGSTIGYFDTKTIYTGEYVIQITDGVNTISKNVMITK